MSHFTVMVIGNNPEEQLEQYSVDLKIEEYEDGEVSDAYKQDMMSFYEKKGHIFTSFCQCYAQFGKDWDDGICRMDENGVWRKYSTYNPNSKWDWFVLGGRWSGNFIRLKPGSTSGILGESGTGGNKAGIDAALKGDIDFSVILKEAEEKARKESTNHNILSTILPYAFIKDGEWYDFDDMGWCDISSNEIPKNDWHDKVWEMLTILPDDTLISFYDCHI